VACKVLELVNTPEMLESIESRSRQLIDGLQAINAEHNVFSEVRGIGLLLGCEMNEKYKDCAREILTACTEHGLLILVAGPNVIRLAPPLNISQSEVAEGLELLGNVIREFVSG
jgi:acetylornithine/succinyldiaminopimelate/putrescine aminotransferase